jgi:hypothetical protein
MGNSRLGLFQLGQESARPEKTAVKRRKIAASYHVTTVRCAFASRFSSRLSFSLAAQE